MEGFKMMNENDKIKDLLDAYDVPEMSSNFSQRLNDRIDRLEAQEKHVTIREFFVTKWFNKTRSFGFTPTSLAFAAIILIAVTAFFNLYLSYQQPMITDNGISLKEEQVAYTSPLLDEVIREGDVDPFIEEIFDPIIISLNTSLEQKDEDQEIDDFIDEIFFGDLENVDTL